MIIATEKEIRDPYKSIANTIYGHEDVKKAIACLLFSGSKKVLRDLTKLRGHNIYKLKIIYIF